MQTEIIFATTIVVIFVIARSIARLLKRIHRYQIEQHRYWKRCYFELMRETRKLRENEQSSD